MAEIGRHHLVLVDGKSRKDTQWSGLTDTMKRAVFPMDPSYKEGDMVLCQVLDASQNALICRAEKSMGVQEFFNHKF